MKQLLITLLLCVIFFPGCKDDEDSQETSGPRFGNYDTDEDIDAPVVACADAFDLLTYSTLPSPTEERVVGLSFNGAGVGLAVSLDRVLWRVTDNGASWEQLPNDLGSDFIFLPFFASEETVYLVRSTGGENDEILLRSDDGGDSFRELPIPGARTVADIHFDNPEEGLALINTAALSETQNFKLLKTTDGGQTWSEQTLPVEVSYDNFLIVEDKLALNTFSNLLVRDSDTGAWVVRPYPERFTCCSNLTTFDGGNNGIFAGGNLVYTTSDAGLTWNTDGVDYGYPEYLHVGPDGTALMLVNRYTVIGGDVLDFKGLLVYESTNGGETWNVKKTDNGCGFGRYIYPAESDRLLSVSQNDLVLLDRE